MKKMICTACGAMGQKHEIKGNDNKEVMDKAWEHMKKDHPEEVEKIMKMPKEEQDKMMMEAEKKIHEEM